MLLNNVFVVYSLTLPLSLCMLTDVSNSTTASVVDDGVDGAYNKTICICSALSNDDGLRIECQIGSYISIKSLQSANVTQLNNNNKSCLALPSTVYSSSLENKITRLCNMNNYCYLNDLLNNEYSSTISSSMATSQQQQKINEIKCLKFHFEWFCIKNNNPSDWKENTNFVVYYLQSLIILSIILMVLFLNQRSIRTSLHKKINAIRDKHGKDKWFVKLLGIVQRCLRVRGIECSAASLARRGRQASLPNILPNVNYFSILNSTINQNHQHQRLQRHLRRRGTSNHHQCSLSRQIHRNRPSLPQLHSTNIGQGIRRRPIFLLDNNNQQSRRVEMEVVEVVDEQHEQRRLDPSSFHIFENMACDQLWGLDDDSAPPDYDKAYESSVDAQMPPNYQSTVMNKRKLIKFYLNSNNPNVRRARQILISEYFPNRLLRRHDDDDDNNNNLYAYSSSDDRFCNDDDDDDDNSHRRDNSSDSD